MCIHSANGKTIRKDYVETQFNKGDKVTVTRKAKSGEKGWPNAWVTDMNEAVGKTGTVLSQGLYGVQIEFAGINGSYQYPEFVVEPVASTTATKFKVGDRVEVKYGYGWDGTGEIVELFGFNYIVKSDGSNRRGGFQEKYLTALDKQPVSAPKFKIGDRVRVTAKRNSHSFSLIPATITGFDGPYVVIKTDGREYMHGSFRPENLEFLPVETGTAYNTAVKTAIEIATRNGIVTADQVQSELSKKGYIPSQLGNAAGAVFRNGGFRKIGEVRSTRPSNRGRKIAQWELVNA